MADQTVRISNLPDSGSVERVAFDMAKLILTHDSASNKYERARVLDLYADCLKVTRAGGYRISELS